MLKIEPRGKKGTLQIIGKVRGIRVHQSAGTTSRMHAEAERIRIEKEILDQHIFGKRVSATFSMAVETYLDQGGSGRFLAPLNEHFGRWLLSNINQAEVIKFAKLPHSLARCAAPQTAINGVKT